MRVREVMQDRRVFRVFRVFVVISDRKVIRDVKVLRVISGHRDPQEIRDLPDRQDHRAILVRKVPEVSRVLPALPVQQDRWDRKV